MCVGSPVFEKEVEVLLTRRQMQAGTSPAQMAMASVQDDPNLAFRQVIVSTEEQYTKGGGKSTLEGLLFEIGYYVIK